MSTALSFSAAWATAGCGKGPASQGNTLPTDSVPVVVTPASGGSGGGSGSDSGGLAPSLNTAGALPPVPLPPGQAAPLSFAPIARHADPSVVTISTVGEEIEPWPYFRGRSRRRETKGLGTGFVVDRDGVILTNNHVIEKADQIRVKLSNDKEYPARIIGRDPQTDVAVVKIDERNLSQLALGDSDVLEVGDWVVAIGNPFGLSHTVSAGIVSAKGRSRRDVPLDPTGYYNFLQTDASINPGNSGGPLLNLKGEVVGINTAIHGGGAQGIGFAIPINMVKQLLPMLLRDGHITRSALGITVDDVHGLDPEDLAKLNLTDDNGTLITGVQSGGPASVAGLQAGDVILQFDGKSVDRSSLLQWVASTTGVGKTVTLRVSRAGKPFDLKVTLGELGSVAPPHPQRPEPPDPEGEGFPDPFGVPRK